MVEELAAQRFRMILILSLGGAKEGSSQSIFSAGLMMAKSMARTAEMVLTEYVYVYGGCMHVWGGDVSGAMLVIASGLMLAWSG